MAQVISVNVGRPQLISTGKRTDKSSIRKQPVEGRVAVRGVNLEGDDQADRTVHGGPDKAVYAYAREDTDWWESELGRDLPNGMFGENLTTRGIDLNALKVGERLRIGTALLEVSEPRFPCWKLGARFEDPLMLRRFADAVRPGTYLRIVEEGELGAGDEIVVEHTPKHDVTIEHFARTYLEEHENLGTLLRAPIADEWRAWIYSRTK
jgi:MOSC domain-containing protein YiiM